MRVHSICKTCQKIKGRNRKGKRFPYQERRRIAHEERLAQSKVRRLKPDKYRFQRNQQNRRWYRDRKDPRLPVDPFRAYLQQRVMENSISGVARALGWGEKRIRTFIQGFYVKVTKKGSIRYDIIHVRYSTVEKVTTAFGDHVSVIYDPDLVEKYRATYYDRRLKANKDV